ncbi:MAG TPA: methyl-accepting chemotaxis protein [Anaeromyxobacteraceae bacterium]|jgi:methyl-accepting chemotaxis protein|nr:methyl-accepting chemotaxis protein [Anaeromyxobacteraceae bacterium]
MAFARRLLLQLSLLLAVPGLVAWYVLASFFPLTPDQLAFMRVGVPLALVVAEGLTFMSVWSYLAPLRQVVADRARGLPVAEAAARGGALCGHRLPGRIAAVIVALTFVSAIGLLMGAAGQGVPLDLALSAIAVTSAAGVMAAMLTYSVCAIEVAPALELLGAVDLREKGTLRGKILFVCYGLLTIVTLLVTATSYVRFRVDADQAYVAAARRAQEKSAAWAELRGASGAAEAAWLSLGAPTAVLGSGGQVVAHYGTVDGALLAGTPQGAGVERAGEGWRVHRPLPGGGTLVSLLPEADLSARRQAFWSSALLLGLVVYAAVALLVWIASRTLTIPIRALESAAVQLAAGDLTVAPPSLSRDEMGQLAATFRRTIVGLTGLVNDVAAASRSVGESTHDIGEIGERVKRGALEEHERVVGVQAAVEAMHGSVTQVGRGVDGLSEYVASTSSAVGEMAAALEEVRRQGAEMERAMETAMTDVDGLSDAGRRAQQAITTLDALAEQAASSLAGVNASLSGLEVSAEQSQSTAVQVAEMAERSGGVVEEAADGIERLREAVGDAQRKVTALGRRSDDIGQIVDFIAEVAGRTNLLSLNASIIAAQAGEHGKAFAVVADQIRDLASQIASSTKSIGGIIGAVRDDVEGTAALIERGDRLAADGVGLARKSLDALHEIRVATARGSEAARSIGQAVKSHAQSSRDVTALVGSVADGSKTLSEAVQLVGRSVNAVGTVSRGVGDMADRISRALEEQTGLGRQQLESVERINSMIADITLAVENHDQATRRVRDSLRHLTRTAELHEQVVEELSGVAGRLDGRSRALAERVGRFKV